VTRHQAAELRAIIDLNGAVLREEKKVSVTPLEAKFLQHRRLVVKEETRSGTRMKRMNHPGSPVSSWSLGFLR